VKDQQAFIVALWSDHIFKISWDEPTGTAVSLAVNTARRQLHGVIFFPRWISETPEKTICYQNEHLVLLA
jgi:phenolic acid decarboxylase